MIDGKRVRQIVLAGIATFVFLAGTSIGMIARLVADREAFLDRELEQHKWVIPSSVYAEPPILVTGASTSKLWLEDYFEALGYRRLDSDPSSSTDNGAAHRSLRTGEFCTNDEHFSFRLRSPFDTGVTYSAQWDQNKMTLLDPRTGTEIREIALEPSQLTHFFGPTIIKRSFNSLEDVPPHLVKAIIATEDQHFYEHDGVDTKAVVRAAVQNLRNGRIVQGGSTITQQMVRNFYLGQQRTYRRKLQEALLATLVERKLTKDEILQMYLNQVYYGQDGPAEIRGVGEASRYYFGKEVSELNYPEAALLAGMIQSPNRYDPFRYPGKALIRRNIVLHLMKLRGVITPTQYSRYVQARLNVQPHPTSVVQKAPFFWQAVYRELSRTHSREDLGRDGLRIVTTLDEGLQNSAEKSLREGLERLDGMLKKRNGKTLEGCLIAVDPHSGEIKAYVGGRNFNENQFDHILLAHRQPGSSFKPFVYAAALESAFQSPDTAITAATIVSDEEWDDELQKVEWQPKNYDGTFHGQVSVRDALAHSMNVATARLAQTVGLDAISRLGVKFGFDVKPYPSLALGAFEVTPWQLIEGYTAFANGGKKTELTAIRQIDTDQRQIRSRKNPSETTVLHPETAFLLTDMLKSVVTYGTGAGIRRWGLADGFVGKTGTTNDARDAWFVGYSSGMLCLVWVGYDDNSPVGLNGAQAALPIWAAFMKSAVPKTAAGNLAGKPDSVTSRTIDPLTGKLASPLCPESRTEFFIRGTEPSEVCTSTDHILLQQDQDYEFYVSPTISR